MATQHPSPQRIPRRWNIEAGTLFAFAGNSGTATTRWNYDPYRGWLKSKDYPDAVTGAPPAQEGTGGPVYTYTPAGRLQSRTWKRGVITTYVYNNAGDLQTIDYSDTTPDVSYTYDRRGRRATAVCNGITTTWTYNDASKSARKHRGGLRRPSQPMRPHQAGGRRVRIW